MGIIIVSTLKIVLKIKRLNICKTCRTFNILQYHVLNKQSQIHPSYERYNSTTITERKGSRLKYLLATQHCWVWQLLVFILCAPQCSSYYSAQRKKSRFTWLSQIGLALILKFNFHVFQLHLWSSQDLVRLQFLRWFWNTEDNWISVILIVYDENIICCYLKYSYQIWFQ